MFGRLGSHQICRSAESGWVEIMHICTRSMPNDFHSTRMALGPRENLCMSAPNGYTKVPSYKMMNVLQWVANAIWQTTCWSPIFIYPKIGRNVTRRTQPSHTFSSVGGRHNFRQILQEINAPIICIVCIMPMNWHSERNTTQGLYKSRRHRSWGCRSPNKAHSLHLMLGAKPFRLAQINSVVACVRRLQLENRIISFAEKIQITLVLSFVHEFGLNNS